MGDSPRAVAPKKLTAAVVTVMMGGVIDLRPLGCMACAVLLATFPLLRYLYVALLCVVSAVRLRRSVRRQKSIQLSTICPPRSSSLHYRLFPSLFARPPRSTVDRFLQLRA